MIYRNDPYRASERRDSRMIQEDQRAIANLPQQCINEEWYPTHFNSQQRMPEGIEIVRSFTMGLKIEV